MTTDMPRTGWLYSPLRWLLIAVIGGILCVAAYLFAPQTFLQAHLLAVVLWTGVSIGALMLLMLHSLVGGNWGLLLRPSLVSAVQPFWLLALAFVPIALGLKLLYPWASWEAGKTAAHLWAKSAYLDPTMFFVRAAVYWALWIIGAWIASRSLLPTRRPPRWAGRVHAIGLPLLVVSVTFASVDWWMSLEPEWFASSYGILILAGQGAAALALGILVAALAPRPRLIKAHDPPHHEMHAPISPWQDVGNLLLAAICLWMYISYSQYLIIWSGNLPEEATWYLARGRGGWRWVAVCLVTLHFALPFLMLLSRTVKENPRRLASVAGLVFAMHILEGLWLVAPAFSAPTLQLLAINALAVASVGAAWFCLFVLRFRKELAFAVE